MTTSISAAGLSQYVLSSGNSSQLQQTLQTLQNGLASGNLGSSESDFQALQTLLQNSAAASGSSLSNDSQLSSDLTALSSALSSGDISTAQSAFTAVQSDLKNASSSSLAAEATASSQSIQLVDDLLSTLNSQVASSSDYDSTTSILESAYGSPSSGLNVYA